MFMFMPLMLVVVKDDYSKNKCLSSLNQKRKYLFCHTGKYVVKHKSAKLFMKYAVGKLEAALNNISYLILKYKQSES